MSKRLPKIEGAKVARDKDEAPDLELVTARFDKDGEMSFTVPSHPNDAVYLTHLYAEGSKVRGQEMCRRLRAAFPDHRIEVVGVVDAARGFWSKMQDRGLIDDWTSTDLESFFGLEDDDPDLGDEDAEEPEAVPADQLLATEGLPRGVRREAELTFTEDFLLNADGELRWYLGSVNPMDFDALGQFAYDEAGLARVRQLAKDIARNGLKRPVVIGPESVEGNHRLAACQSLGMESIPAYRYRLVEPPEVNDPEAASLRTPLTAPVIAPAGPPARLAAPGMEG